jgi:hypothetical protein
MNFILAARENLKSHTVSELFMWDKKEGQAKSTGPLETRDGDTSSCKSLILHH